MNSTEKSNNNTLEDDIESVNLKSSELNQLYKNLNEENKEKSNTQISIDNKESLINIYKDVPEDLLKEEEEEIINKEIIVKKDINPQTQLNELIQKFYNANPFIYNSNLSHELEVKFGTKGIKQLTKNDYDNVIKKLKSFGFVSPDNTGKYYLRINSEFLDSKTGKFKLSDIRAEINGLHNIQDYCKHNDLKSIYKKNPTVINFTNKRPVFIGKEKVFPVNFNDFNFRVTYLNEENVKSGVKNYILENWKKNKKVFRYINRVTFRHEDYPFLIDISIVKYANKGPDRYGNAGYGDMTRVYTTEESNVFNNPEIYEIEIEVDNLKIGPTTKFNTPQSIAESLRKVIKFVLGGLQGTNYPISYPEQKEVLHSYMKMIWKDEFVPTKPINNKYFIGPNSITLQMVNVAKIDDNCNEPNIRKNFVVTEKADGDRHLMYISNKGKIYLINTNMDVIFTGAKTDNNDCFNCLLDGELIPHDKNGVFINLYASFDIYYFKNSDVRNFTFMLTEKELDIHKSRYNLMKYIINALKPVSILDIGTKHENTITSLIKNYTNKIDFISPIRIKNKEFYPTSNKQNIFSGCDEILSKVRENRFEYETDGLIFTHMYFGVGSDKIGEAGPKNKITWGQSFKWKPPKYNTIDFLITTEKGPNGNDVITPIFEDGISASQPTQFSEYKTIELRCGFDEKTNIFINPCQDIIDDKLPQFIQRFEDKKTNSYVPKRFYPTEPYDPNAGICNIMLRTDDAGVKQMFSDENEVFTDNTIVEFSYDFDRKEGWRWVPLRVRHDKTSQYRKGQSQYGNDYKTCNENWKSIHNPITDDMISTGLNIPDISVSEDKYYNTPAGKFKTEAMKNFHNLYVKKLLIKSVSKQGDTLIDYACGKAGDLSKWISARLSFVFGVDLSKDNLENRLDGACARFLKARQLNKNMPYALFVNGNSSYNIKNGSAMLNDKAKQITAAIFGNGPKDAEKIGKGVIRQYGVGEEGFNVSSCQFAIHYFMENPDTLQGFMKNLAECTKRGGYFIGTAYDGNIIFNLLKKTKTGESIKIVDDGKKIWEVTKGYGAATFDPDSSSIGYRIDVYQESINQQISEYLVNFNYLDRVLDAYGFKLIDREEAQQLGLPEGSGLFSELFFNMEEEIKINKYKGKDYANAANMTAFEKKISFLNRYFVYKKIIDVNTEKVYLEMSEYQETDIMRNNQETTHAIDVAKDENKKLKPKIRKLDKKLLLVAATEAVDEQFKPLVIETEMKKDKIKKGKIIKKKLIIIEEDEE